MEFSRLEYLIGDQVNLLKEKTVLVLGLGGVGGYTVEALVRSGIGHLILVDYDTVDITNINRQVIATYHTVGRLKTEAWKERILSIVPTCQVTTISEKITEENINCLFREKIDFVVDACDTISVKCLLIKRCLEQKIPLISSMGTANKLDPTKIEVTDIHKTTICPLARVMRKELKDRKIKKLKVVYSTEQPKELKKKILNGKKITPGSVSFVPSVGGLIIASVVINDLLNKK